MVSRLVRAVSLTVLGLAAAGAAEAQLVRARQPNPNAPKLLVTPYNYEQSRDSAVSLLVADGTRERLRVAHLDRFNTISRQNMNENLIQSGYPSDAPLDPPTIRTLARFLNARFVIEGRLFRRGDSVFVAGRLYETAGQAPQSANVVVGTTANRVGSGTGGELANRLMDAFQSFDNVQRCNQAREQNNFDRAIQEAQRALREDSTSASAWLCISMVREALNADVDSVIVALREAYRRDTLNTIVMRRLAQKYEADADTNNLVDMVRRILTIDRRDNDLRVSTAAMLTRMNRADDALAVINQGLETNPASLELLRAKSIAFAALSRWAEAASTLQQVGEIDSASIDSLYIFRITNYYKNVPDSTGLHRWTEIGTRRTPQNHIYWYDLATLAMARADTNQSMEAARQYLQLQPTDARGHVLLASVFYARRMFDSALAHADAAAASDSTMRPRVAPFYLAAGGVAYGDSNWVQAAERFQRARDWSAGRGQVRPAYYLGVAQLQIITQIDREVEPSRSCDSVRRVQTLLGDIEQNMAQGAAENREVANDILSRYVPALRQRYEAFSRNWRCGNSGGGSPGGAAPPRGR